MNRPLYKSLEYIDPVFYFERLLSFKEHIVFLDSVIMPGHCSRYSYLGFSPFSIVSDFVELSVMHRKYKCEPIAELPPFQGGMCGYLSYDLGRTFERLPNQAQDDMHFPLLEAGVFDVVISFDHMLKKAWVVSTGFPELDNALRMQRANERLLRCLSLIENVRVEQKDIGFTPLKLDSIKSNFSKADYKQAIERTIEYIKSGDIFEANLSQRFLAPLPDDFDTYKLYRRLRQCNPAPFAAYVRLSDAEILSCSPERFLQVCDRQVETRPIKGTIHRSADPQQDNQLKNKLANSEKDRAENTMIVDLMRNDLSKVCQANSVKVPQYCEVETFETVHHLVSVVTGELDPQYDIIDLIKAAFPGGSITGAPKIRAMEIIDELEPTRRGPYCGSVFCLGFNDYFDSSILIRSCLVKDQKISFQGGGAIVLDSDPESEYEETLIKVNRLIEVLVADDIVA